MDFLDIFGFLYRQIHHPYKQRLRVLQRQRNLGGAQRRGPEAEEAVGVRATQGCACGSRLEPL